jgi:hypothetical protein
VVHAEVERGWRGSTMPKRMFNYSTALHAHTGLPVVSVVVLLRPGGNPPRSPATYTLSALGHDLHVMRYFVVPLWSLNAKEMRKRLPPEGTPFCVAMKGADPDFIRGLARDLGTSANLPKPRRNLALGLLYVMTAAILGAEKAERIFHMESIIRSPGVQKLIKKWEDKGRAEGEAQGEARGRAKDVLTVLSVRKIEISDDARQRILECTDLATLDRWIERAAVAVSAAEVIKDG